MISEGFTNAFSLLFSADPNVWGPIWVSLFVSVTATTISAALAVPSGLLLGLGKFRLRRYLVTFINTMMAIPTVLIGLLIYALLSRRGPLGDLDMLYTQSAMIAGEVLLAFPIMVGFCSAAVERSDPRIVQTVLGLGGSRFRAAMSVAAENRSALAAAVAAGFGRVFSEVGIAMMVGGNIKGQTRTITTGIAFETGKGEFAVGVALGIVLLVVALVLNLAVGTWNFRKDVRQ